MWVIKDEDSTIYLLGTFHILRPETIWNVDKIKQALGESTELWLEVVDDGKMDALTGLIQKYGYDRKKPLSRRLTKEQRARLAKTAELYTFPMKLLEPMKPWYAGITLMMMPLLKAGYNPNAGVEQVLQFEARAQGDTVAALETMEEQLQMLSSLSEADQIALLMQTLGDVEEGLAYIEKVEKAWSEGDTGALEKVFVEEMKTASAALYQRMLTDRNVRWSEKIAEMLKGSGVQMIAVGAGHLVGPDSVQAQLAKHEIIAEQY